jgi:uncharacterized protein (DUF2235 family)
MAKNIVLLSDGTGQRGGVAFATNVWLLNEALPRDVGQFVCYDDGVGSQKQMLVRAVGGAFGVGLARNIRHLYSFLVRTWESGDNIFLFGFSRGAFTVRLLAGLIARCGLVKLEGIQSDRELDRTVRAAYCAFRTSQFYPGVARRFKKQFAVVDPGTGSADIPIRFVGVWDTVAAVGVPLDELRDAFDQILRYSFRDNVLSPAVEFGRHAVAIDETRRTFAPVMWEERLEEGERIKQVWFSGVHSNVGGGYPKRQLAMIPLTWMMHEAIAKGLRVEPAKLEEYERAADIYGRLYDSRAGVAAYYRYSPRDMNEIGAEYAPGDVKIHHSVFERIEHAFDSYSPHNLPDRWATVGGQTTTVGLSRESRKDLLLAKGVVWWHRFLLGILWVVTGVVLVSPWWLSGSPAENAASPAPGWLTTFVKSVVPDAASTWTNTLLGHPWFAAAVALTLIGLLWARARIKSAVIELANAGWYRLYPKHRTPSKEEPLRFAGTQWITLAERAQKSTMLTELAGTLGSFVIGLLSLALFLPLKAGQWLHKHWCLRGARLANVRSGKKPTALRPEEEQTLLFLTKDYKRLTGIRLKAGETYRIKVEDFAGWCDGSLPASPDGLAKSDYADRLDKLAWSFKRHPSARLMTLMARVQYGCCGLVRFASTTRAVGTNGTITPKRDGELTLYVNDTILINIPILRGLLFGIREMFYANNRGVALIRISRERAVQEVSSN